MKKIFFFIFFVLFIRVLAGCDAEPLRRCDFDPKVSCDVANTCDTNSCGDVDVNE